MKYINKGIKNKAVFTCCEVVVKFVGALTPSRLLY